jgi:hypothetical protein
VLKHHIHILSKQLIQIIEAGIWTAIIDSPKEYGVNQFELVDQQVKHQHITISKKSLMRLIQLLFREQQMVV